MTRQGSGAPLYLRDARYVDWRSLVIRRGDVRVDPGSGGAVQFVESVPEAATVHDCAGRWVTKAFANAHQHIYSMLARGMAPPDVAPRGFRQILERVWWKLDSALDADAIRASALACAVEAARCGTTFVIDHHASPNAARGSLDIIGEALSEVGLAHLCCYELSDRDGPVRRDAGFTESADYLEHAQGLVGLHASFTVSDELLDRAVELAAAHATGIHVHVAEDLHDQDDCLAQYGKRVVQRFAEAGALGPKALLAHCLHLDAAERGIVQQSGSWVVQNTESNQLNGVGVFDPSGLDDRILIGTDGMHADPVQSARAAHLADTCTPAEAYGRLRRVHDYLSDAGFAGDGDNNLVVLDYDPPTAVHADNWPAHLMYGIRAAHVHSVLSDGRLIIDSRKVTTVDEAEVFAAARKQAKRLWQKL